MAFFCALQHTTLLPRPHNARRAEEGKIMNRCNELCTKEITGQCALCDALAERDRFIRFWFKGGFLIDGVRALKKGKRSDEIRERKEASHEVLGSPFDDVPKILASHQLWRQSKKT